MTPCEQAGYEVGDLFRVVRERPESGGFGGYALHSIVRLATDDKTERPFFQLVLGAIVRPTTNQPDTMYMPLICVVKLTKEERCDDHVERSGGL